MGNLGFRVGRMPRASSDNRHSGTRVAGDLDLWAGAAGRRDVDRASPMGGEALR